MSEYIVISGFNIQANNRGTAALGYGALSFLQERGWLEDGSILLNFRFVNNPLKKQNRGVHTRMLSIQGMHLEHKEVNVPKWEKVLYLKTGILFPFSRFRRYLRKVKYVAAINGGDGFSDIYSTRTFFSRLHETNIAMKSRIPLVILPQTLGPFKSESNKAIADRILSYASKIFVRDTEYNKQLEEMGVKYEVTKDLSYYMRPESFDINIKPNSVGINISGLAYSNKFRALSGQFGTYPYLINQLIEAFQRLGTTVYLIPHSYNKTHPELDADDMQACSEAYHNLKEKTNIFNVNQDLTSPQVKYIISQMSYFIGTRMHANFAAIYTGVPVYGLAYSYKFEGAFKSNAVYDNNVSLINNISEDDADAVIETIIKDYTNKRSI